MSGYSTSHFSQSFILFSVLHSAFHIMFATTFLSRDLISSSGLVAYIRFVQIHVCKSTTHGEHTPSSKSLMITDVDQSLGSKNSEIIRI